MPQRTTADWRLDPSHNTRMDATRMPTETPTNTDQAVNPVPVTPPDMATLQANLDKATAALAAANGNITQAAATNDIPGMIAAGKDIESANKAIDAANKAITRAGFEARAGERNAASETLKGIADSLAAAIDIKAYLELSLTGFSVVFNADGTALVNVNGKSAPKANGTPRAKNTVGGGRVQWHKDAGVYTPRELVNTFGTDEEIAELALRDTNWASVMGADGTPRWKMYPGIDGIVKGVARRIGANGEKNGVAIIL